VNDIAPKDRDIAMVFQNYALYPHMTVYDNIAFGLKLRKMPKPEILKTLWRPWQSPGLMQPAAAARRRAPSVCGADTRWAQAFSPLLRPRAIVRDAKVFLMDEPLSNLDAKLRVQMRAEIIKHSVSPSIFAASSTRFFISGFGIFLSFRPKAILS
jgi:multiple sugar transport system ATP-binding protein